MEDGDLFDAPPSEDDFYFTNGVRFVQPYAFDFVCHVKKRQEGVTIVELFIREFPNRPKSYYEAAHGQGLLRVEKVTPANNGGSKKRPPPPPVCSVCNRRFCSCSNRVLTEPQIPGPEDCCQSIPQCKFCVWTVYEEQLEEYRKGRE